MRKDATLFFVNLIWTYSVCFAASYHWSSLRLSLNRTTRSLVVRVITWPDDLLLRVYSTHRGCAALFQRPLKRTNSIAYWNLVVFLSKFLRSGNIIIDISSGAWDYRNRKRKFYVAAFLAIPKTLIDTNLFEYRLSVIEIPPKRHFIARTLLVHVIGTNRACIFWEYYRITPPGFFALRRKRQDQKRSSRSYLAARPNAHYRGLEGVISRIHTRVPVHSIHSNDTERRGSNAEELFLAARMISWPGCLIPHHAYAFHGNNNRMTRGLLLRIFCTRSCAAISAATTSKSNPNKLFEATKRYLLFRQQYRRHD